MKRQVSLKVYLLTVIGIIIVAVSAIVFLLFKQSSSSNAVLYDTISVEYGESMQKFEVINSQNETLPELPKSENKYSVIFYLSATCHGCTDIIGNFDRIQSIFGQEKLGYYYLWTDEIPVSMIKEYQIDEQICYSMGLKRLATSTPTFYIVDKDMNVVFSAIDPMLLVEKLVSLDIYETEELVKAANEYLKEYLLDASASKHLVYFAMEGCPDCEAINPLIESEEITGKYDVLKIYKYDDLEEGRDKDSFGIFKEVYGIEWYPSFLVFSGNEFQIVGEMPVDDVEKLLLEQ